MSIGVYIVGGARQREAGGSGSDPPSRNYSLRFSDGLHVSPRCLAGARGRV